MAVASSVSPFTRGILATMASSGVSWYSPEKGISTVAAPMLESNRSESPFWQQTSSRAMFSFRASVPSFPARQAGTLLR